jgi:crotonobetainyl-CoA:carnitine CoA-transferase CaiB-like acyl-CoA transferase
VTGILDGLSVLDLSWGIAGPVTTMLLADHGAAVVKVEPPGGDPFRDSAGYVVWNRGKRSLELDLHDDADREVLLRLVADADVLVESFRPGVTKRLGLDHAQLRAVNERLVTCSITGYGRHSEARDRPGYDALVQARSGIQHEQFGLRDGPIFLHLPIPSYGAALLASVATQAALLAREQTGQGQWVETSLMQGALLFTTMLWSRAERPTPPMELFKFMNAGPSPCYETADGLWLHPMDACVPVALEHLGRDRAEIDITQGRRGTADERIAYFEICRELWLQRPRAEWLEVLDGMSCQPVLAPGDGLVHPQTLVNRASTTIEVPGLGPVTQVGHVYRVGDRQEQIRRPGPAVGADNAELRNSAARSRKEISSDGGGSGVGRPALEGIRILDFGHALAGPFGTMILADLGADVIKIDNTSRAVVGSGGDIVYAACQRGKRSIGLDLKTKDGRAVAARLIATADVVHHNLRVGVAERLGFGRDDVASLNPRAIYCHVTGFGSDGPLADWPGSDQMGQALSGLEFAGGATETGGHPIWYRFGMTDAATGMLSAIGVLQALRHRSRTGEPLEVEANILNAALLLSSDAVLAAEAPLRPPLDLRQTGLGPLYRLYRTADEWICIAAPEPRQWPLLCAAVGAGRLEFDPRFAEASDRWRHREELGAELESIFATQPAAVWLEAFDRFTVPAEISHEATRREWFDDPDARASGWVAEHPHPIYGFLTQPGRFFELSGTPSPAPGPPPTIGRDGPELLAELGFEPAEIERLRDAGAVTW